MNKDPIEHLQKQEAATKAVGNVLGSARAEADFSMLEQAFVETAEYKALVETQDFNFVVGRRGTGKSTLFHKIKEYYGKNTGAFLITETPEEFIMMGLQERLRQRTEDYREGRAIFRLLWKVQLFLKILEKLKDYYKFKHVSEFDFLRDYAERHKNFLRTTGSEGLLGLLQLLGTKGSHGELLNKIHSEMQLPQLEEGIRNTLASLNRRAVIIFDGLDEGWVPSTVATAILGGLAVATADLKDHHSGVHCLLFIRDNMFRSLASLDNDFARHIEDSTLRLHWNAASLLQLVTKRVRIALNLQKIESDIRVWNRFAQRELQDRIGFENCLRYTLYRPRDILVLLNSAYMNAARLGRSSIIGEDIEASSKRISSDRLDDLRKEYETVFPGLARLTSLFRNEPAQSRFGQVVQRLDEAVENSTFEDPNDRDLALLGSGREMFFALYSVGFLGLQDPSSGSFTFCHDGSAADLSTIPDDRGILVHPCYWKALDLQETLQSEEMTVAINDEYKAKDTGELQDLRVKRLGQILGELPKLPLGPDGANDFEKWVFNAITLLFAGKLSNVALKPNGNAIQRRDLVATNMAASGFWRRILEDYESRQVVFEVKNYEALKPEDFRQVLSYSSGEYGRFSLIVSRDQNENPSETEKGWIRTLWHEHKRLILILPAIFICRCISKLRTTKRHDYTEDSLSKRMDTFVRSYLSLKHQSQFHKKRKKSH